MLSGDPASSFSSSTLTISSFPYKTYVEKLVTNWSVTATTFLLYINMDHKTYSVLKLSLLYIIQPQETKVRIQKASLEQPTFLGQSQGHNFDAALTERKGQTVAVYNEFVHTKYLTDLLFENIFTFINY